MKRRFAIEVLVLLVMLGVFTFVPMNQFTINGATFALFVYAIVSAKYRGITRKDLGIELPSKSTLMAWLFLTLAMVAGIVLLKLAFSSGVYVGSIKNRQLFVYIIPFYIIFGTFFQEFIFRGYLYARTLKIFSVGTTIAINIALFSLFHFPYFVQLESNLLYLSMIAGACWSFMYVKHPNLYLAWISHGIIGSLSLLLLQKF